MRRFNQAQAGTEGFLLARRSQYHQSVLAEYTRSHRLQAVIHGVALKLSHAGVRMHEAQRQPLGRLYGMVQRQVAALSYIDVYWLPSVVAAAMFMLSFFLRKNQPGGGEVPVH
jgi:hypothetical protein